jgi:hypothetical protein
MPDDRHAATDEAICVPPTAMMMMIWSRKSVANAPPFENVLS